MKNTLSIVLALLLFAPTLAMGDTATEETPPDKISRWESNLSAGVVLQKQIGIVKSFWWYPLPRVFAVGLSFDYIGMTLPLSLNASLNLPLPVVVPFVCAGAGASVSRGGITHFGGGLKFRVWRKIGFLVEYRKYSHRPDPFIDPPDAPRARPEYIGAGIAYIY